MTGLLVTLVDTSSGLSESDEPPPAQPARTTSAATDTGIMARKVRDEDFMGSPEMVWTGGGFRKMGAATPFGLTGDSNRSRSMAVSEWRMAPCAMASDPSLEISRRGGRSGPLLSASSRASSMIAPEGGHVPTDDDDFGVEQCAECRHALGESCGHGPDSRERPVLAALRGVVELVKRQSALVVAHAVGGSDRQELAGPGPPLERPQLAVGVRPMGRVDDEVEVADVAGVVRRATIELAVQHDAGADPLAPVDEHEGVLLARLTAPAFALGRELDVVVEVDRAGDELAEVARRAHCRPPRACSGSA